MIIHQERFLERWYTDLGQIQGEECVLDMFLIDDAVFEFFVGNFFDVNDGSGKIDAVIEVAVGYVAVGGSEIVHGYIRIDHKLDDARVAGHGAAVDGTALGVNFHDRKNDSAVQNKVIFGTDVSEAGAERRTDEAVFVVEKTGFGIDGHMFVNVFVLIRFGMGNQFIALIGLG